MRRPDAGQSNSLTRVREARRDSTPAERLLWSRLRSRQCNGAKFRRQVWLGNFIADFLCADAKLVVEVDGDTHAGRLAYDQRRTDWLANQGFHVLRATNRDVMQQNLEGVLDDIAARLPSPSQPAAPAGPLPLP